MWLKEKLNDFEIDMNYVDSWEGGLNYLVKTEVCQPSLFGK